MATTTAPRWLDHAEHAAWVAFVETYADLQAGLERDLASSRLTLGDYQVLVYLSESDDGQMRMCDLAQILQLSPSGLTRRLDGLVDAGFVARTPSPDDRRVMLAELTADGRAKIEDVAPVHVESVRARMIDLLDRDEVAALERIFTKVRAALDADPGT